MATVFIGLGSNIESERNLREATQSLRRLFPGIRFSSVYRTQAHDYDAQSDFLNAVAIFQTDNSPETILQKLQTIEQQLKKEILFRFGPRTIDLDLLLYGDLVLPSREYWKENQELRIKNQENMLYIPHLRMHERRFVLEPLCELLDLQGKHPVLGVPWKSLLWKTTDQHCDRVEMVL